LEEMNTFSLRVCRDGRIMLRVASLEREEDPNAIQNPEEATGRWGEYLDYLNAFYLLLDSATVERQRFHYFNLHEITTRDAFRVTFENGNELSASSPIESVGASFQFGRYLSTYLTGVPVQHTPQIAHRVVIPLEDITHAVHQFAQAFPTTALVNALAAFAKALGEYKAGNYETSIVLAWFVTETAIVHFWNVHLDSMNAELEGGRKRINAERRKFLTGRDFTISIVSNLLELWGVFPHTLFSEIDDVRGFRNAVVHRKDFSPTGQNALLAIRLARAMIERRWGFNFTPNEQPNWKFL
jgi:hypothetical protein